MTVPDERAKGIAALLLCVLLAAGIILVAVAWQMGMLSFAPNSDIDDQARGFTTAVGYPDELLGVWSAVSWGSGPESEKNDIVARLMLSSEDSWTLEFKEDGTLEIETEDRILSGTWAYARSSGYGYMEMCLWLSGQAL